jgi:hypothetical protein
LIGGCGKGDESQPPDTSPAPDAIETMPHAMQVWPITHLEPNQTTHVAVDSAGNAYWVQESSEGNDQLYVAGEDDIPQAMTLNTAAILAAFGPPPTSQGAATQATTATGGSIESIATDRDDNILFFFNGGTGREARVMLGVFNPRNNSVHLLVGTQSLMLASGMGVSISLARGEIIPMMPDEQSAGYWLWLHHSDQAVMERFDRNGIEADPAGGLTREFDRLVGGKTMPELTNGSIEFCASAANGLLMVDHESASLWRVDEHGDATKWTTLIGLPAALSALTPLPDGSAIAFAPVGSLATGGESPDEAVRDAHYLQAHYPGMLAFTNTSVLQTVGNDEISAPRGVDISHLMLSRLVPAGKAHQYIAYDSASGLLLRIRMVPKN